MIKEELKKGVSLCMIKDDKFKSFRACIMIHRPLLKEEVTLNTLLAATLRMQCEGYSSFDEISATLEDLYGADLIARASKYGEQQVIKIGIQAPFDSIIGEEGNFQKAMELLKKITFYSGNDGVFSSKIVDTEKKNIEDSILAQKNDKRTYSTLRLQEEMCKNEPYGINPLGYIEELKKIDCDKLWNHYKKVLCESKIDIIFTGNFCEETAKKAAKDFASELNEREYSSVKYERKEAPDKAKTVTDYMDVTQGKLCLGFRAPEGIKKEKYASAILYNTIFGGSATSKLFNNVREKLSLCYYVSSNLDRLKEIMIVRSGVEFENFEKAYNEILAQQSEMCSGSIEQDEIDAAKKFLKGTYSSNYDSIAAMEEYYTMQLLIGSDTSIEEMVDAIEKVTKDDIVNIANGMKLDTIYYLDAER